MCRDSAETIKALVIDWLIASHNDIVIGNEVMYGTTRKVVDLLAIINNEIIAIEIKSASDNLNRLSEQIQEYRKIFDRVIIVSSPSHKDGIQSITNKEIGLYIIDKTITKVHSSRPNRHQNKIEMLFSISSNFLKKIYPQYKRLNSNEIRAKLSKKKKSDIHQLLILFSYP